MANGPDDTFSTSAAGGVVGALAEIRREIRGLVETLWAARDGRRADGHGGRGRGAEVDPGRAVAGRGARAGGHRRGEAERLGLDPGLPHPRRRRPQGHRPRDGASRSGDGRAGDWRRSAAALRDGWLSTAKAQVIERAVDGLPGNPEIRGRGVQVLLADAKKLDASELKKVALHLNNVVDPDRRRTPRRARARSARTRRPPGPAPEHHRRPGGRRLDQGTLLDRGRRDDQGHADPACDAATLGAGCDRDSVVPGCGHDGRDLRDHGVRMLDALTEACRRLQSADLLPETHGATPRLTLTMDYQQLLDLSGLGATETGEQLSASAVRRLCCDAEVIPAVLGGTSQVLDVGRQLRLASTAIWKALVARDRHCRFGNCTRPPLMCHAHHITHWVDGGETSLDNMLLLCGHHHRLVHSGPWQIRRQRRGSSSSSRRWSRPRAPRRGHRPRMMRRQQDHDYSSASKARKNAVRSVVDSRTRRRPRPGRRTGGATKWRRASGRAHRGQRLRAGEQLARQGVDVARR